MVDHPRLLKDPARLRPDQPERLQKVIARTGIASRRKADALIHQGRVTVNGEPAELGQKVSPQDAVRVDGRRLRGPTRRRYFLVNKPRGVMTTVDDPEGRTTVLDLLPRGQRRGLFPVGRLDYLTEGLLLMTDDGDLAQRVGHPRFGCRKEYEVKVKGSPSEPSVSRLETGIVVDGRRTAPCRVRRLRLSRSQVRSRPRKAIANSWWRVSLGEGRSRQIREMFQRIGHPVQRLRRVRIGTVEDRALKTGDFRELTVDEVVSLRDGTRRQPRKKRSR